MIPRTKVNYGLAELARAALSLESRSRGRAELTDALRELTGCRHILLTASGRGALYAILKAVDRRRVLIPSYTCKAVDEAALLADRHVVRVPTEPDGFNMDVSALEGLADGDSVIVATHQFGIPCDIDSTMRIARERGALVVEDAAASLGTRVHGRLTGTIGDIGFFSFDSTKLVTVPLKGGFIATDDDALAERIASVLADETLAPSLIWKAKTLTLAAVLVLIENGVLYRLFHWLFLQRRGLVTTDEPGLRPERTEFYRHEMTNWQARIAIPQIRRLDSIVATRRRLHRELRAGLEDVSRCLLPPPDTDDEWACIRFPVRVRGDKLGYYRQLIERDVDCAFSFTFIADPSACELARGLADSVLDLPYYEKLTDREVSKVIAAVKSIDSTGEPS